MSTPRLSDALATAHVVHDKQVLEDAIRRMATEIRAEYDEGDVPVFLTVMNGGLPFAAQLAFALGELGLDLQFDYLHATRYRGQTSGRAWPGCTARRRRCRAARCCWPTTSSTRATHCWRSSSGARTRVRPRCASRCWR